ncbi:MAG: DEAD/DEAH box helicase family protein [Bifidobacteriaceae bacterium]|jgi:superfamily II DNA or RNA helicase|nr:DEAD/DEAH box helicase family protein [Bifidobacteriaceae bacterium]
MMEAAGYAEMTFRGRFRPYQAEVLRLAEGHLADGRIHIVAAPGSGKTVLGLELIRRLGGPALVLSPTLVISEQWASRLAGMFLPPGADPGRYVSHDLRAPALLTSVTYQALHAAYRGLAEDQIGARPDVRAESRPDDGADGLVGRLRERGVTVVCLDEAHHLRREWHEALQEVLRQLGPQVRIIALTATPPYDADQREWLRYSDLCGPIDAEIAVPELVADATLCPHQDYIYFSLPTREDAKAVAEHRRRVRACLDDLRDTGVIEAAVLRAAEIVDRRRRAASTAPVSSELGAEAAEDCLYEHSDGLADLLRLAGRMGVAVPKHLFQAFPQAKSVGLVTIRTAQSAVDAIAGARAAFGMIAEQATALARRWRLFHMGRFEIAQSQELDRLMANSLGKLGAIGQIAAAEDAALGGSLRLVVLTDYIRADHLALVGSAPAAGPLSAIGAVPIFEALRRSLPAGTPIGLLTGSLVLWPNDRLEQLRSAANLLGVALTATPLRETGYVRVAFEGSNRLKVAAVTEAFRRGAVRALVGTAALLGEGWDSPCVNALVMASVVGSFVLSNQMRGRAIRTDPANPDKTANVWHLVALAPADVAPGFPPAACPNHAADAADAAHADRPAGAADAAQAAGPAESAFGAPGPAADAVMPDAGDPRVTSQDYLNLSRRFRGFFGPAYSLPEIRTGIGRVDIVRAPLTKASTRRLNAEMMRRAADREGMARAWREALAGVGAGVVHDIVAVPAEARALPLVALWWDVLSGTVTGAFALAGLQLARAGLAKQEWPGVIAGVAIFAIAAAALAWIVPRFGRAASTKRAIGALAAAITQTMAGTGRLTSPNAHASVICGPVSNMLECSLVGATAPEQAAFAQAMCELLAPIANPRYLIVGLTRLRRRPRPAASFAAPRFVSTARAAGILRDGLRRRLGLYDVFYTRNEVGHALLNQCRRRSCASRNARRLAAQGIDNAAMARELEVFRRLEQA